jgi:hypothetical protein
MYSLNMPFYVLPEKGFHINVASIFVPEMDVTDRNDRD